MPLLSLSFLAHLVTSAGENFMLECWLPLSCLRITQPSMGGETIIFLLLLH